MIMKKSSSDSKKNTTVKFDTPDEDTDQFDEFMKGSGVKQLSPKPDSDQQEQVSEKQNQVSDQQKQVSKQKSDNSVEFVEEKRWQPRLANSPERQKFAGRKKPAPQFQSKKKISKNFRPDATLDLHGQTREDALARVERFLQNSKFQGFRSVLIITGRGTNSYEKEGVLKAAVWEWLRNQLNNGSIRFQRAPAFLGGEGAILVFF